ERFGCQLCLARDRVLHPELRENVDAHMRQAHVYLAEVSLGSPNVMYEVGRARALFPTRPIVFLMHPHPSTGKVELPADLNGLVFFKYKKDATRTALADHLERELRKSQSIVDVLERSNREVFVSVSKLRKWSRPLVLADVALEALASRFPTAASWNQAQEA